MEDNHAKAVVFGINFSVVSISQAVNVVALRMQQGIETKVVFVNSATVVMCVKDKNFLDTINNSNLVLVDGMPVLWMLKLLNFDIEARVCGPDFFKEIIKFSSDNHYGVYFLGAKKIILNKMVTILQKKFRKLAVCGQTDGYYDDYHENKIINKIKKSKARILFIGMPSPKKEIIIDNISIKGLCSIAVGGVFDIESGFIKRAPQWMQKLGLEWFFRLTKEPRKMYKRYLITNTMFIIYSIKELIKRSKYYDFKK